MTTEAKEMINTPLISQEMESKQNITNYQDLNSRDMYNMLGTHDLDEEYDTLQDEISNLKSQVYDVWKNRDTMTLATYSANPDADDEIKTQASPKEPVAGWRQHRQLVGHNNKIYALRWCPRLDDQKWNIVSAAQDGNLIIWNVLNGAKHVGIPLKIAWVMTCGYSPNGQCVASGGLDNVCSVFNVQDQMGWGASVPCSELKMHEGYVSCCRFVSNEQILTASGDSTCILWDIDTQSNVRTFADHDWDVQAVALVNPAASSSNANRTIFVSGSTDSTAKIWDIRQPKACATFKGHVSDINTVQWFPDGQANTFASGSDDTSVRLFDVRAFREMNKYENDQVFGSACSVDFSKSGHYLIAGYDDEPYCLVWNTVRATQVKQLEHPNRTTCLQVSPNGYCVATGAWDKMIRIWA